MSGVPLSKEISRDRIAARTERRMLQEQIQKLARRWERQRLWGGRRAGRKEHAAMVILQDRINDIELFLTDGIDVEELRNRLISKAQGKFGPVAA